MSNVNIELQRALINHAFKNKEITELEYTTELNKLKVKQEELLLKNKLREYENKEIIEKYKKLSLTI